MDDAGQRRQALRSIGGFARASMDRASAQLTLTPGARIGRGPRCVVVACVALEDRGGQARYGSRHVRVSSLLV